MRALAAPCPSMADSQSVKTKNTVTAMQRYVKILGVNSGARAPSTVQAFRAIRSNKQVNKNEMVITQTGIIREAGSAALEKTGMDLLEIMLNRVVTIMRDAVKRKAWIPAV